MSKPEPESEPSPEPEHTKSPISEAEYFTGSIEPSSEAELSSAEPESVGEPFPEWGTAVLKWGFTWQFYQYGLGGIFAVIGLLAIGFAIRLRHCKEHGQKKTHVVNFLLLALFGLTRGLILCVDAYHSKQWLPKVAINILWGTGQPCIITAYTLVFIVLRNALMLKQRFQNWYTTKNITLATLPYFCIVFVAEITVSFVPTYKGLPFTCQLLYVLSNLALVVFYSFIGFLLWRKLKQVRTGMEWKQGSGSRMRRIFRTCCAAVTGGALLCATNIYAISGVYGVFSTARNVSAWPWLAFNMAQRVLEIFMCVLLFWILAHKGVSSSANTQVTVTKVSSTRSSVIDQSQVIQAWTKTKKVQETELTMTEVSDIV